MAKDPLFYRNTILIWIATILVLGIVFLMPARLMPITFFLLMVVMYLTWTIYFSIHPWRLATFRRMASSESWPGIERVWYKGSDGIDLCGYYISGSNRRSIILLHGLGSSGMEMHPHGKILNEAGYSIFMTDLRAHGASGGRTVNGVREVQDLKGVLEFLKQRSELGGESVGILGISFGALVGLRSAATYPEIRALVLESMGPAALEDHGGKPDSLIRWLNYPLNWFIYGATNFFGNTPGSSGVIELLKGLRGVPVFFISAGRGKEQYFMRRFYQAARNPKQLWEAARSMHGITLAVERENYQAKVTRFFDRALLPHDHDDGTSATNIPLSL